MDYEIMMNGIVKIGQIAPEFEAMSTQGKISLSDYKGRWIVLFSHPGSHTPVCTTEFIAFAKANTYFQNLNTELIGLSIDSNPSQLAWLHDIMQKTGIEVPFPVIADRSGEIARKYGMISSNVSTTETVRNVFIIDDKGVVRTIFIYPLNIGRWIPEILRVVESLQVADCNKAATPANWIPGQPIIKSVPTTFRELKERNKEIEQNKNGMNWYLSFRKSDENCTKKIEQNKTLNEKNGKQEKKNL